MKKLVLTTLAALAVAGSAMAQGTVTWSINNFDYTAQTNSTQYSPLFGGGPTGSGAIGNTLGNTTLGNGSGFYVELLYQAYSGNGGASGSGNVAQPSTLSQLAGWSDSGLGGTNSPTSAGKAAAVASNVQAPVPWANGTTDSIMVVEWSANLGTTFANALATMESPSALAALGSSAFFGETPTGYLNPNASGVNGPTIFNNSAANTANGIEIFSLNTQLYLVPVPEPSTIAMAAFGGLSLLALRRKK